MENKELKYQYLCTVNMPGRHIAAAVTEYYGVETGCVAFFEDGSYGVVSRVTFVDEDVIQHLRDFTGVLEITKVCRNVWEREEEPDNG